MTSSLLDNHVEILSGFAFSSEGFNEDEGMPVVRIRDVVPGVTETRFRGDYDQAYVISNGDTLIGMDGQFNVGVWAGGKALLNQRVCRIKAKETLDDRFLYHFLPQALKKIEDSTPFVTVKHLSVRDIRTIRLDLPSLAEQRRIAAILDQAEALRAKRRQALSKLDTLSQSVFLEMFGDPEAKHDGTHIGKIGDVCTRITYGFTSPMRHVPDGIPILTAKHVQRGWIDFSSVNYAERQQFDELTAKCKPNRGDVLLTKDGTIGRCAVLDVDYPVCIKPISCIGAG